MSIPQVSTSFGNRKLFQEAFLYSRIHRCVREFSHVCLRVKDPSSDQTGFFMKTRERLITISVTHSIGTALTQLRIQQGQLMHILEAEFTDKKTGKCAFDFKLIFCFK